MKFLRLLLVMMGCAVTIGQAAADDWGLVRVSVANLRGEGKESAEMVSQALMGTPVKILQKNGSWYQVETPDTYQGWMDAGSIAEKTEAQMADWRKAPRLVMTYPYQIEAYDNCKLLMPRYVATDLVNGDLVEGSLSHTKDGMVEITLPDGRKAWAKTEYFTPIEAWADQPFDADMVLDQAFAAMGAPYLWGGLSTKATDCSGLVRLGYWRNGRLLMRDASQQAKTGTQLDPKDFNSFQPGDLLFFGNKKTGKITHVALYTGDNHIIHASNLVRYNSIIKGEPDYYDREILSATRIAGNDGNEGITKVIDHPLYFEK